MVVTVETHRLQQRCKECQQRVRRWETLVEEGALSMNGKDGEELGSQVKRRHPSRQRGTCCHGDLRKNGGVQQPLVIPCGWSWNVRWRERMGQLTKPYCVLLRILNLIVWSYVFQTSLMISITWLTCHKNLSSVSSQNRMEGLNI